MVIFGEEKRMLRFIKGIVFLIIVILGPLAAGCDGGGGGHDFLPPLILPLPGSPISISGTITFDLVPTTQSSGLDYSSTTQEPVRGAVVEAVFYPTPVVLDSTTTDASGDYTLDVTSGNNMFIRVKAQMSAEGPPGWNFMVVDNTRFKALYAMDSAVFNSGDADITGKDLNASSGWGGSAYTSARAAGPFAILDTVYKSFNKVLSADPTLTFQELKINWSIENKPVGGNKAIGEIGTSHFSPSEGELYILGMADNDTDEYDDHVVAHEWGHYFEHFLSRADSVGGSHGGLSDRLDPRVAFGEGFGNAVSGMITDDPDYIDTQQLAQSITAIFMDLQVNPQPLQNKGWYSELSVQTILYNLYENTFSRNITPIYDVLVGDQKTTPAFTTIFSFIHYLKEDNAAYESQINALLADEIITVSAIDEWDSTGTETNDAGDSKTLPVYTLLVDGDPAAILCSNQTTGNGNYNKLNNRKYFYFEAGSSGTFTVTADPDSNGDPVIALYSQGTRIGYQDAGDNGFTETLSLALDAGTYVGEVYDWYHVNNSRSTEECFNVSLD